MSESARNSEAASPGDPDSRTIGNRYRVVRELGHGTSARTLLCIDAETNKQVAVKELHFEHLGDWKFLDLFEREAKVLSMLEHDGIPRVLDFFQGDDESSTLYIVQEFMPGSSLKQRMEEGPMLGQQEVYDVALGLLNVLEYLHGRSPPVLHRDIKPSNVLVGTDGRVALVDFGGVLFSWRPPDHAGTTVVGTFGYMPAEQLLGQAGPTSDLYALGATLLHLVTGTPPHQFSFDSGRIEIPQDLPARPSLRRLIEALLRPAPRDRPASAADARLILTDRAPFAAGTVPQSGVGTGLVTHSGNVTIASGDGPRFVDLGPPPRDLHGEFRDVYRNLVNPLFPAKRLWSTAIQSVSVVGYVVLSVMTMGIVPLVYVMKVRNRKRKYTDLFRNGQFTRGHIRSAQKGEVYAVFKYQFEVHGSVYIAFMEYAEEMTRYWGDGDTVPVLYDADDPQSCCFVYR